VWASRELLKAGLKLTPSPLSRRRAMYVVNGLPQTFMPKECALSKQLFASSPEQMGDVRRLPTYVPCPPPPPPPRDVFFVHGEGRMVTTLPPRRVPDSIKVIGVARPYVGEVDYDLGVPSSSARKSRFPTSQMQRPLSHRCGFRLFQPGRQCPRLTRETPGTMDWRLKVKYRTLESLVGSEAAREVRWS
jgi:hypothetical protein